MTDREAYVAFNLTDHIGSVGVAELAARDGSVAAAWERYPKKVSRTGGKVDCAAEFAHAAKFGVRIVTPADAGYPKMLLDAPGHPLALYVKGSLDALAKPGVAIVGTRRATAYGLDQADRFGHDLAAAGWCVISGLALGIDAAAHRGALAAGGTTVGIIGSGLDQFYPEENRDLAREIVKHGGAVVSEFPFGRTPDHETFPQRNHVVAALARGVLAVEAPVKSGTLITTGIAADLGRTVMAVPGRVDARASAGCLQLIRDGALLVRCVEDVLSDLAELFPATRARRRAPAAAATDAPDVAQDELPIATPAHAETPAAAPKRNPLPKPPAPDPEAPPYSVEEALVMLHVDAEGVSLEKLVTLTKLPPGKVNAVAMGLRLKGVVRFLPGNRISLLPRR